MIKAIFFDVDGTLFSHGKDCILDSTKEALEALRRKGIYTFVASGRHRLEMQRMPMENLEQIGFEGFLTLNGQFCYNRETVIYQNPIDRQDIRALLKYLRTHHQPCGFFERCCIYINYNDETVRKIYTRMASPLLEERDILRAKENRVYQLSLYGCSEENEGWVRERMPHCRITRWNRQAADVYPADGGKRRGMKEILQYYKIKPEETMAFGDGDNDMEMLQFAGISVAMGNARPHIKKYADFVTDDAEHDGIYHALCKYKII